MLQSREVRVQSLEFGNCDDKYNCFRDCQHQVPEMGGRQATWQERINCELLWQSKDQAKCVNFKCREE